MFSFKPSCPEGERRTKLPNSITIVCKEMVLNKKVLKNIKNPHELEKVCLVRSKALISILREDLKKNQENLVNLVKRRVGGKPKSQFLYRLN